ncbi:hypothetical protein [Providencia sp. PROV202]|uniref:hypothetical protein n=1 Tax=Providencia sp. PROV202 TaxID=2949902 RepID=UPI00234AA30D|nr:hypothetical protein [Providencia sp. PROV202]
MKTTTTNLTQPVQLRRMSTTAPKGNVTKFSCSAKSVNNNSTPMPKSILKTANSTSDTSSPKKAKHVRIIETDQKNVRKKDISRLTKEINAGIKEIRANIKDIMSNDTRLNLSGVFSNLTSQFFTLQDNVALYQDKLNISSYNHHKSKQASINKLNNKINATAPDILIAKGRVEYINQKINEANSSQGVKSNLDKMIEKNQALKDRVENGYT